MDKGKSGSGKKQQKAKSNQQASTTSSQSANASGNTEVSNPVYASNSVLNPLVAEFVPTTLNFTPRPIFGILGYETIYVPIFFDPTQNMLYVVPARPLYIPLQPVVILSNSPLLNTQSTPNVPTTVAEIPSMPVEVERTANTYLPEPSTSLPTQTFGRSIPSTSTRTVPPIHSGPKKPRTKRINRNSRHRARFHKNPLQIKEEDEEEVQKD